MIQIGIAVQEDKAQAARDQGFVDRPPSGTEQ
jgi:hypothetical protein